MGQLALALDPVPYCFALVAEPFRGDPLMRGWYLSGWKDAAINAEDSKLRPAAEWADQSGDPPAWCFAYWAAWDDYRARHPEVCA